MAYSSSKPAGSLFLVTATIFLIISSCRADPDPLQDFCVANLQATDITSTVPLQPTSSVVSDDFFFSGLSAPGNTNNMFGSNVTQAATSRVPRPTTRLASPLNRVDLVPGGINPSQPPAAPTDKLGVSHPGGGAASASSAPPTRSTPRL
ncbi:Germin-like protein 3-7 [Ananas comosus]|uniref:Germin-like protein 3-7 n=1 Tax=Ananas comosus TaxID=4615 RepID=A0A199V1K3_ANACO|nr:Germin-like protein 3-7 [Ananas comosus]